MKKFLLLFIFSATTLFAQSQPAFAPFPSQLGARISSWLTIPADYVWPPNSLPVNQINLNQPGQGGGTVTQTWTTAWPSKSTITLNLTGNMQGSGTTTYTKVDSSGYKLTQFQTAAGTTTWQYQTGANGPQIIATFAPSNPSTTNPNVTTTYDGTTQQALQTTTSFGEQSTTWNNDGHNTWTQQTDATSASALPITASQDSAVKSVPLPTPTPSAKMFK